MFLFRLLKALTIVFRASVLVALTGRPGPEENGQADDFSPAVGVPCPHPHPLLA